MPTKWRKVIILLSLLLLFLITVAVRYLHPSAEDVARAHLVEQGWPDEQVVIGGFQWSTGLLNITESQKLDVYQKGTEPLKQIEVRLSRPVYFLGWRVVGTEAKPPR